MTKWQWFGQAGHFVAANRCRFHLHTHVGKWCVSTVGDWFESDPHGPPKEIGVDRLYETMVFEINEDGEVESYAEAAAFAPYNDRDAANAGHMAMCRRYEMHDERVARLQDELVECDREQER